MLPQGYASVPGGPGTQDESADLRDILARDIPWETYMTARLISDHDLQLIRRYDKRSEELQASLLDEVGVLGVVSLLACLFSCSPGVHCITRCCDQGCASLDHQAPPLRRTFAARHLTPPTPHAHGTNNYA
jgi:hypothetical protein